MTIPNTPIELLVGQISWVKSNINNNLDFIPAEKLDWKPAPSAKSVLEIVDHFTGTVHMMTGLILGQKKSELTPATDAAGAKALITQVVDAHIAAITSLSPDQLREVIDTPFGDAPKAFVAGLPVIELVNHHGQITYIETLLGDSDSHMLMG